MTPLKGSIAVALAVLVWGLYATVADVSFWSSEPRYSRVAGPYWVGVCGELERARRDVFRQRYPDIEFGPPTPCGAEGTFSEVMTDITLPGQRAPSAMLLTRPGSDERDIAPLARDGVTPESDAVDSMAGIIDEALDRPQPRSTLLPGPALVSLALWWLAARLPIASARRSGLRLALALLFVGSLAGWPIVLMAPTRLFPAVVLATMIALAVSFAVSARVARDMAMRTRVGAAARGGVFGLGILVVFTAAFVNIHGFITPVFRPPDASLSPGAWLHHDFIRPAISLMFAAMLPSALFGVVYGWWYRRARDAAGNP
ncbi:MAG: hypothetical protein AAF610_01020 [Pseudomonadota bacterium]